VGLPDGEKRTEKMFTHVDTIQTSALSCAPVLDVDFVKCPRNCVIGSTIILTFVVVVVVVVVVTDTQTETPNDV